MKSGYDKNEYLILNRLGMYINPYNGSVIKKIDNLY